MKEVYVGNGSIEEAIRVTKQATALCQKCGDAQVEAETISSIANLRMRIVDKDPEGVRELR